MITDIDWVRAATRAAATLMPCPVKMFGNDAFHEAITWLMSPYEPSVTYRMLPERGVLVVEPHARLRAEDFDVLTTPL